MSVVSRCFGRFKPFTFIPEWQKPINRDPFDYRLRTKAEVEEERKANPPYAAGQIEVRNYVDEDPNLSHLDFRNAVVRMTIDIKPWNLTDLQKKRFLFLVGPRFKKGKFKVVVRQYTNLEQNMQKCMDIIKEVWLETKRAP